MSLFLIKISIREWLPIYALYVGTYSSLYGKNPANILVRRILAFDITIFGIIIFGIRPSISESFSRSRSYTIKNTKFMNPRPPCNSYNYIIANMFIFMYLFFYILFCTDTIFLFFTKHWIIRFGPYEYSWCHFNIILLTFTGSS